MKSYQHENYFFFELYISTITRNKKLMYYVTPAPIIFNDTLKYIDPRSPFIIVNKFKTEINYLSKDDFAECQKIKEQEYLCLGEYPTYTKASNQCELEILNKDHLNDKPCVIKHN